MASARIRNKLSCAVKMSILIWATLVFTATDSAQSNNKTCTEKTFNINPNTTNQTASAGDCVVLNCSFKNYSKSFAWYDCHFSGNCKTQIFHFINNNKNDSEIGRRVSLLGSDQEKNCNIIFNNLTTSYTGFDQVIVETANGCIFDYKNITVKVPEIKLTLDTSPQMEESNATLTCSAPGLCSGSEPQFTWMFREAEKKEMLIIDNNTDYTIKMMNPTQSHSSTLTFKVSAKHHRTTVACRVNFPGNTTIERAKTLDLRFSPRIMNSSACQNQSDVLTCVCVSRGFPLPTIAWLLLDNISKYTVSTSFTEFSVTSNMTVSLKKRSNITVKCMSKNNINETTQILTISNETKKTDQIPADQNISDLLKNIFGNRLLHLVILGVGILIGSLVSTFIVCLAIKCHRKKKSYSTEELELVTTETVPKGCDAEIPHVQDDGILDLQDDGIQNQEVAECGVEPVGDLIDSDMSPADTVYSDIDFSALKEKSPENAKEKDKTPETEYAEIKRVEMEEEQENEGMDSKMIGGNDETEVMIDHLEEPKQGILTEEVIGEDVPIYSKPNEVMDEN